MIIGITGGVGAGKSTVMDYMAKHYHVYTILSDDVARGLQQKGEIVYEQMLTLFGREILGEEEQIDRAKLASIVFADPKRLDQLNRLVHPAVKEKIIDIIAKEKSHYPHIAVEAALLIEDHYDEICDELWFIDADEEVRISRLQASRGYSREKSIDIMKRQLSREKFAQNCQRVIDNSGDILNLKRQLDEVLGNANQIPQSILSLLQ